MNFFISMIGILGSLALLKWRQQAGDMIGEAEWMKKLGGVYNVIIIAAVLIFFFSIAKMTGTTDIFLSPITGLFGGGQPEQPQGDMNF